MNEENITLSGISSGDISGSAGQEDSLSGSITEESISGNLSDDSLSGDIKSESEMNGNLNIGGSVSKEEVYEIIEEYLEENPVEAVSDYPDLTNKPKINDVELEGNKTLQELGIQPEGDYASIDDIPTKNSQLENDRGYLTEHQSLDGYATESWVEGKGYLTEHQDLSSYALKTEIPINVSELENDSGYLTEHQDLSSYALKTEIPQVPSWAMQSVKPKYTATEVGADPTGSAENALGQANSALSTHNTSTDAHNDIRLFLIDIANRLNALANSDDETLDQMNEVVAYIKDNRELIEQITTNKVNVADIIDNLTTNVSNKPLSAAQGVALKLLFDSIPTWAKEKNKPNYTYNEVEADKAGTAETKVGEHNISDTAHDDIRRAVMAIKVPTKVSELENDKNYLTEHQDLSEYALKTEIPKVPSWSMQETKPEYIASEVGAEKAGTAEAKVSEHNASGTAHEDIRSDITALQELNTIGTVYQGAWIATETTGISQRYTETITLPPGTYVINVVAPYCADFTARVCISFSARLAIGSGATFIDAAYGTTTMIATFASQTNLHVLSAASNNSAKWSYLERGGIAAVRIR